MKKDLKFIEFIVNCMQSIIFEEIAEDSSVHRVALERLAKSFNSSKRVVALTGAGISVSAGIPVNY